MTTPREKGKECWAKVGGRYLPAVVIPEPAFVLTRSRFKRLRREFGDTAAKAKYAKLGAYYNVIVEGHSESKHMAGQFIIHGSEIRLKNPRGPVFDDTPFDTIGKRRRRRRKAAKAPPPAPTPRKRRKAPPPPVRAKKRRVPPPAPPPRRKKNRRAPPPPPRR